MLHLGQLRLHPVDLLLTPAGLGVLVGDGKDLALAHPLAFVVGVDQDALLAPGDHRLGTHHKAGGG